MDVDSISKQASFCLKMVGWWGWGLVLACFSLASSGRAEIPFDVCGRAARRRIGVGQEGRVSKYSWRGREAVAEVQAGRSSGLSSGGTKRLHDTAPAHRFDGPWEDRPSSVSGHISDTPTWIVGRALEQCCTCLRRGESSVLM